MSCPPRPATSKNCAACGLDTARCYGYELVMPPLLEHLESLLTGTGECPGPADLQAGGPALGRTLGLRADTTPQVARIDAHLLNRTRRDPPVLLRPGAAHPPRQARTPPASPCSLAPKSMAMPGWRPTSKPCCWPWRACGVARRRLELGRWIWPMRASCNSLLGTASSLVRGRAGADPCPPLRWQPRTPVRTAPA